MLCYCRTHNKLEEYEPFFKQWTDEELCNYGLTLCHMTDKMMMSFLEKLEREFITEGGIKERMYRARTGYRQQQDERLKQLELQLPQLQQQLQEAQSAAQQWQAEAQRWQSAYDDLKHRALSAYNRQKEEIERLQAALGRLDEARRTR